MSKDPYEGRNEVNGWFYRKDCSLCGGKGMIYGLLWDPPEQCDCCLFDPPEKEGEEMTERPEGVPGIALESVKNLSATPEALELIEMAGRTCYKSEDKITPRSAEKFARKMIKLGHESTLEHAVATFRIVCDRGISHEIVRHRLASYSQESTRYCNYKKKGVKFIPPPDMSLEQTAEWMKLCHHAEASYEKLLELGFKPEFARSVLPTSLKTEIVMTANFREWRHFLKLRTSKAAHPQIRIIANEIMDWFNNNCPVIVEDLPYWAIAYGDKND